MVEKKETYKDTDKMVFIKMLKRNSQGVQIIKKVYETIAKRTVDKEKAILLEGTEKAQAIKDDKADELKAKLENLKENKESK